MPNMPNKRIRVTITRGGRARVERGDGQMLGEINPKALERMDHLPEQAFESLERAQERLAELQKRIREMNRYR